MLRKTALERILLEQAFRNSLRSAAGSPEVRDGKQGANETSHPVIGVCDVMEEIEADSLVQLSGGKIRF